MDPDPLTPLAMASDMEMALVMRAGFKSLKEHNHNAARPEPPLPPSSCSRVLLISSLCFLFDLLHDIESLLFLVFPCSIDAHLRTARPVAHSAECTPIPSISLSLSISLALSLPHVLSLPHALSPPSRSLSLYIRLLALSSHLPLSLFLFASYRGVLSLYSLPFLE